MTECVRRPLLLARLPMYPRARRRARSVWLPPHRSRSVDARRAELGRPARARCACVRRQRRGPRMPQLGVHAGPVHVGHGPPALPANGNVPQGRAVLTPPAVRLDAQPGSADTASCLTGRRARQC
eukprot:354656-Chlamydomonas_euryale.AAC.8